MKQLSKNGMFALMLRGVSLASIVAVGSAWTISAQAAPMTEALVQSYASAMKSAANSKNINKVAQLVSDDALISLSRKGKTTSLDKAAYLQLLQRSWNDTSNYRYDITIDNIVTTGAQAKANVTTHESWVKDGNLSLIHI